MTDREKQIAFLLATSQYLIPAWECTYEEAAKDLVANGVTVQKHGRWVNERELVGGFNSVWGCDCSECGRTIKTDDGKPNFCPECGADMRGE